MRKAIATIFLVLLTLCMLAGCEREYTPDPAVREFLNNGMTAEKAYERIATASYTEVRTLSDKQDAVKGTFRSEVYLDKSNADDLKLTIRSVYEGECIEEENITEMHATLVKSEGEYLYTVEKMPVGSDKPTVTTETMKAEDAQNLLATIIYTDNEVYDEGLYYGDLFMLRIFRFPAESFYVDAENGLCVFDEGMLIKEYYDMEDVQLYQTTKINDLGLLVYNKERYVATKSDYVLTSETTPTYTYL